MKNRVKAQTHNLQFLQSIKPIDFFEFSIPINSLISSHDNNNGRRRRNVINSKYFEINCSNFLRRHDFSVRRNSSFSDVDLPLSCAYFVQSIHDQTVHMRHRRFASLSLRFVSSSPSCKPIFFFSLLFFLIVSVLWLLFWFNCFHLFVVDVVCVYWA